MTIYPKARLLLSTTIPCYALFDLTKQENIHPPLTPTKESTELRFGAPSSPIRTFDTPGVITFRNPFKTPFNTSRDILSNTAFRIAEVDTYYAIQSKELPMLEGAVGIAFANLFLMGSMLTKKASRVPLPIRVYLAMSSIFGLGFTGHKIYCLHSYQVLTGKTYPYTPTHQISETAKRNLVIAHKLLAFTEETRVWNYPERSIDPNNSSAKQFNGWIKNIDNEMKRGERKDLAMWGCQGIAELALQKLHQEDTLTAISTSCQVASPIVLTKITQEGREELQSEGFQLIGDKIPVVADHAYIVIGDTSKHPPESLIECVKKNQFLESYLPPITSIRNISMMPDTIICDPWTRSCYPAAMVGQLPDHWRGTVSIEGKLRTCVCASSSVVPTAPSSPVFVGIHYPLE